MTFCSSTDVMFSITRSQKQSF